MGPMWDSICRFESVIEKPVTELDTCDLATFIELEQSKLWTILPLCQPDVSGGWHSELQLVIPFFRVFCFCASKEFEIHASWCWEQQLFGFRFRVAQFSVLVQPAPPEQATYSPKQNFMLHITHILNVILIYHLKTFILYSNI